MGKKDEPWKRPNLEWRRKRNAEARRKFWAPYFVGKKGKRYKRFAPHFPKKDEA